MVLTARRIFWIVLPLLWNEACSRTHREDSSPASTQATNDASRVVSNVQAPDGDSAVLVPADPIVQSSSADRLEDIVSSLKVLSGWYGARGLSDEHCRVLLSSTKSRLEGVAKTIGEVRGELEYSRPRITTSAARCQVILELRTEWRTTMEQTIRLADEAVAEAGKCASCPAEASRCAGLQRHISKMEALLTSARTKAVALPAGCSEL